MMTQQAESVDPVLVDPPVAGRLRLGEILLQSGKINHRDLDRALNAQHEMGGMLGKVLVQLGVVSELDISHALSKQLNVPFVTAEEFPTLMPEVEGVLPDFLVSHNVLPLRVEEGRLDVAMAVPQDDFVLRALHMVSGLEVRPFIANVSDIERALAQPAQEVEGGLEDLDGDAGDFVEHLKDLASEAPVIRLVNAIVGRVIDMRASDIHLEPFDDGMHVRYRVDGVIHGSEIVPPKHSAAVGSRVKLLAHLDIAERRLPQDGRIKTRVKGRELDLRVSTVPTVHGESIVMRVLDRASVRFSLVDMGFATDTLEKFNGLLARPHGILLVTGPTGSGKTTTLYAALAKLDSDTQKIITVEDPVEYQLEGINQIQVKPSIGLDFAGALRSIVRQDPDVIMIGEMRDLETCRIAIQSSLTGHLVLSTLHTNSAAASITRLLDMGVESYLIASTVKGILAQRLVRRLDPATRIAFEAPAELVAAHGLERFTDQRPIMLYQPASHQANGGYHGRSAITELLVMNEELRSLLMRQADASTLEQAARRGGLRTLYEEGLRQAVAGVTSLEEVLRVTRGD